MSHQRYPSHDAVKEPHSVSLKVLRLSRPSLVTQNPLEQPLSRPATTAKTHEPPAPASLAYSSPAGAETNPAPFILTPALNLPVSFGSAYVGETFSCTLCANNDLADDAERTIRDVRVDAEMKTPGVGRAHKLDLRVAGAGAGATTDDAPPERDLGAGQTLQGIVSFDLKEEGNHVLAVTVSYYEGTLTSGRTRTFRKLYQFICKPSLVVRTKVTALREGVPPRGGRRPAGRWALEAQLENCSDDVMQLDKVAMEAEGPALRTRACNWEASGAPRPVLQPGEVEQVCFVVEEEAAEAVTASPDGRLVFGVLGIGWRGEMGNRGFLTTGKLGTKVRT